MGSAMRKAQRTYNLDARIAKELAKEKRPAAPRHETEAVAIQKHSDSLTDADRSLIPGLELNPATMLEDRVKHLQIRSTALDNVEVDPRKGLVSGRPLPVARHTPTEEINYLGFQEPLQVAPGRLKMSSVVALLMDIKSQALLNSEEVANKYNIAVQDAEDMQKYFGVFQLKERAHRNHIQHLMHVNKHDHYKPLTQELADNKYDMWWVWPFEEGVYEGQLRGHYRAYKEAGVDLGDPDEAIKESRVLAHHADLRFEELGGPPDSEAIIEPTWKRVQRERAEEKKLLEQREHEQQFLAEQEAAAEKELGHTILYTPTKRSNVSGSYKFTRGSSDVQNIGSRYRDEEDDKDAKREEDMQQLDAARESIAIEAGEHQPQSYKVVGSPSLVSRPALTSDTTHEVDVHRLSEIQQVREAKPLPEPKADEEEIRSARFPLDSKTRRVSNFITAATAPYKYEQAERERKLRRQQQQKSS